MNEWVGKLENGGVTWKTVKWKMVGRKMVGIYMDACIAFHEREYGRFVWERDEDIWGAAGKMNVRRVLLSVVSHKPCLFFLFFSLDISLLLRLFVFFVIIDGVLDGFVTDDVGTFFPRLLEWSHVEPPCWECCMPSPGVITSRINVFLYLVMYKYTSVKRVAPSESVPGILWQILDDRYIWPISPPNIVTEAVSGKKQCC